MRKLESYATHNRTIFAMLVFLVVTIYTPYVAAAESLPIRILVNGESVRLTDPQPFFDENGRIQVPLRFISEELGAEVKWNNATKVAMVVIGSNKVEWTAGKQEYILNGHLFKMDTAAIVRNGRLFVPIRFIGEALAVSVFWDQKANAVFLDTTVNRPADEGEDGKVNYNGFVVDPKPASQLVVGKGIYSTYGSDYALLLLMIVFDVEGANYEEQCKDAEAILLQKVDKATVAAVMNYVKNKTTAEEVIAPKVFTGTDYKVKVITQYIDYNIGISVFEK